MYSETFEKLYKTISEFISCKVSDFFYSESTQRENGHSKGTPRALAHSGTQGIWGIRQWNTWSTLSFKGHLRYFGNQVPEHLGIRRFAWALKDSGIWTLGQSRHSRHFFKQTHSVFFFYNFLHKNSQNFFGLLHIFSFN